MGAGRQCGRARRKSTASVLPRDLGAGLDQRAEAEGGRSYCRLPAGRD